jgi:hypothetical protein
MSAVPISLNELKQMKENVRRVVDSLDICWRCQNVTECQRHVLGNLVLVWLCSGCRADMDQLHDHPPPQAKRTRKVIA